MISVVLSFLTVVLFGFRGWIHFMRMIAMKGCYIGSKEGFARFKTCHGRVCEGKGIFLVF